LTKMTRLTRVKSFDWKRQSACANQRGQTSRRRDCPNLFLAICSLTLDKNDSNGDDVKVEGAVMATRLLGTLVGTASSCSAYRTKQAMMMTMRTTRRMTTTTMRRRRTAC
jgi:hypothetical protein